MTRFRSRSDGYNQAVRHWLCRKCGIAYVRYKPKEGCGQCRGHEWDYLASRIEYERWHELSLLQKAGEISALEIHPAYYVELAGTTVRVEADFAYMDGGLPVIEDVKPRGKATDTELSRLKRLLLQDRLGLIITVVEV